MAEYPDQEAAAAAIRQVAEWSDIGLQVLDGGRPSWVDRRGIVVVANRTDARIFFGVRHELIMSPQLVRSLASANRSDPLGHLWLTGGEREGEWLVVWGATLPYRWTTVKDLQRALISCLIEHGAYLGSLVGHFARFGGVALGCDRLPHTDELVIQDLVE